MPSKKRGYMNAGAKRSALVMHGNRWHAVARAMGSAKSYVAPERMFNICDCPNAGAINVGTMASSDAVLTDESS